MKKLRIGLVTNTFLPTVGGLEWKVHYLATQYVRMGHDVTVFAERPGILPINPAIQVSPIYNLIRCGISFPGVARLGLDRIFYRRRIMQEYQKKPYDILHCHQIGSPARYGLDIKKITGIPVISTTSGADVQKCAELGYGICLDPKKEIMVRDNLQKIDVVGSISASVRKDIERLSPKAKIVDIPNGVDWENFQIGPQTLLRDLVGISDDSKIMISVGRNHKKKGYALGLAAFAKIASRFPNCIYVLVGKEVPDLESTVAELGLKNQVFLLDQITMDEIPYYMHSSDIFFNPSLLEGFAQVNAQALCCGLPMVITDAPGNADAGLNGGALIARSADVDSIAEKLEMMLSSENLQRKLGKEAFDSSRRYSWETIAQQYVEIFHEFVG
jgi:glycosyltransferase involved in cell wall biosynthesis